LLGRLALYGAGAARLHEEIIAVTAIWSEADRDKKPLAALGVRGEETTLDQLREHCERPVNPRRRLSPGSVISQRDAHDLEPELRQRAEQRRMEVARDFGAAGRCRGARSRPAARRASDRIAQAERSIDRNQLALPGIADAERRQQERDHRHWRTRLVEIEREIQDEPARVCASYEIRATRLEPIGLVYLWPHSN